MCARLIAAHNKNSGDKELKKNAQYYYEQLLTDKTIIKRSKQNGKNY